MAAPLAKKPKGEKVTQGKKSLRAPACTTREMMDAVLPKLTEPFKKMDVVRATGCDYVRAGSAMARWKKDGLIKKSGLGARGGFVRTSKAPAVPAKPGRAPKVTPTAGGSGGDESSPLLKEGSMEREVYMAALKAPEEFTAPSLAVSMGRTADAVTMALMRIERSGLVVVSGRKME